MAISNEVVIGIGSNIEPYSHISKAVKLLRELFLVEAMSSLQSTKPIGITNQPDFINGVVKVSTTKGKDEVVRLLKNIEDELGRDRSVDKYGPRIIDLDVVLWNGDVVDEDYYSRDFLQQAVNEVLALREG